MSFYETFQQHDWDTIHHQIQNATGVDVETVLSKNSRLSLQDFGTLISPAAASYIEPMAAKARDLTRRRFGSTMQIYAPLYLSNECTNVCTYCGFSMDNKIPRRTLTPDEIMKEVVVLKELGVDHVLIVTGEANSIVGMDYFKEALDIIRPWFANISIEVQPLEEKEYAELRKHGAHAVMIYQETYHQAEYKKHHPKGKKSIFKFRLETPDRLGRAGIHKIGLGALFGLEDWRVDSFFTALHLEYLEVEYWQTKYSISFPRLRPHAGGLEPKVEMTDRDLAQLIFAWRLYREEIDISLSTRESESMRDNLAHLGVTTMSAGSMTNPGGYAEGEDSSLEQFSIDDQRSPKELAASLRASGLEPVWKDWDAAYDKAGQNKSN
mgnify:CR=1 FL=1